MKPALKLIPSPPTLAQALRSRQAELRQIEARRVAIEAEITAMVREYSDTAGYCVRLRSADQVLADLERQVG